MNGADCFHPALFCQVNLDNCPQCSLNFNCYKWIEYQIEEIKLKEAKLSKREIQRLEFLRWRLEHKSG